MSDIAEGRVAQLKRRLKDWWEGDGTKAPQMKTTRLGIIEASKYTRTIEFDCDERAWPDLWLKLSRYGRVDRYGSLSPRLTVDARYDFDEVLAYVKSLENE